MGRLASAAHSVEIQLGLGTSCVDGIVSRLHQRTAFACKNWSRIRGLHPPAPDPGALSEVLMARVRSTGADRARFVFKGTVQRLGDTTDPSIEVTSRTAVVRVDEVVRAPQVLSTY